MNKLKIDQEKVIRYLLTIGFTLFIFIVLFLFLIVSRLVLSDTTLFGEHVKTTKTLLENIDKVEKAATQDPNLEQNYTYKQNNAFLRFNYVYVNVTDISYRNFNENRSVITLIVDKNIYSTFDGIYYFKIENISSIEKGEILVYNSIEPKVGEFLEFEESVAVIANSESKSIEKINLEDIMGRVFINQK